MQLSLVLALTAALVAVETHGADFCDLIRCSQDVAPVCASNGLSFPNACHFQIAKCHDETLTITAVGECTNATTAAPTVPAATLKPATPTTAVCEMMCMDMYAPVCGSNGQTYTNKCQLQLANCNQRIADASAKAITVATESECVEGANVVGPVGPVVTPTPTPATPAKNETGGEADAGVVANATTAAPAKCPTMCPQVIQPVCASNGKTYNNQCEFNRAKCIIRIAMTSVEGACATADADKSAAPTPATNTTTTAPTAGSPAPAAAEGCRTMCMAIEKPVCGSNGQTYSNQCEFDNAKCTLRIAMTSVEGECAAADAESPTPIALVPTPTTPTTPTSPTPAKVPTRQCSQMCREEYKPVCGSNGKTYGNECLLNADKCKLGTTSTLAVASKGKCPTSTSPTPVSVGCPGACPKIMRPVCGSDGVTYNSPCEFNKAKCTKRIANMTSVDGACAPAADDAESPAPVTRDCPTMCTADIRPVCGSNNVTYSNQCEFEKASCTLKIAPMSFDEGECK